MTRGLIGVVWVFVICGTQAGEAPAVPAFYKASDTIVRKDSRKAAKGAKGAKQKILS